ncbi:hypothetical protein SDC9_180496 [bioreactor metagenome]|uniref:Uncharacterized protein n=1 Tax=bioreactor metagenome TaxID=1076179 RepID=A0A645HB43_9ZZZZ
MGVQQFVDELGADDAPAAETAQRVGREPLEARVLAGPDTEGQAEAVLLLGDDLVGEESTQGFLEEPAQGHPLHFPFWRDR